MSRSSALRVDAVPTRDKQRTPRMPVRLRLVAPHRPRLGRGAFAALVLSVLGVGLLVLLLLNTWTAQSAFVVNELEKSTAALERREQALAQQVARLESPAELESRARALGMVASDNPVFLRLADGKVLGVPAPAAAPAAPSASAAPTPPAIPAPRPTASAGRPAAAPAPAVPAPEAAEEEAASDAAAPVARSASAPSAAAPAVPAPEAAEEQAASDAAAPAGPSR